MKRFLQVCGLLLLASSLWAQQPVKITDGTNNKVIDPCQGQTKSYANINMNTATTTKIVTGTAAKKIYVCSIHMVAAGADNVSVVEGTGANCATTTVAVDGLGGGGTAATGWNFGANGGIAFGNGNAAIGAEHTAADDLCIATSAAVQLSGGFSYVVQ